MGTLTASSSILEAGIGGGNEGAGGNVTINGGNVTASGGQYASGIGGGNGGAGGAFTINSGTLTANGRKYASGIGKGQNGTDGTIYINLTNDTDSITASSYGGTVTLAEGKSFAVRGTSTELTAETMSAADGKKVMLFTPLDPVVYQSFQDGAYQENTTSDYVTIMEDTGAAWEAGTYVLLSNVTISDRIAISGEVLLILADGFTLDANNGFDVPEGSQLSICNGKLAESDGDIQGTGTLNAGMKSTASTGGAGICGGGVIVIDGGVINAQGLNDGAGVGGGSVTINGGTLTATGTGGGAGISVGSGGSVTIKKDAAVTATGGTDGAAAEAAATAAV